MTVRELLEEGIKVIVCKYADNSEVRFMTTLNKEELELRDLASDTGQLYDLETLQPIDLKYVPMIVDVVEVSNDRSNPLGYTNKLDQFISKGIRR